MEALRSSDVIGTVDALNLIRFESFDSINRFRTKLGVVLFLDLFIFSVFFGFFSVPSLSYLLGKSKNYPFKRT